MIFKPFALIFGGIGVVMLLVATGFTISTALFLSQSAQADGVVIEAAPPGSTYKSTATIEFTTADGRQVQFNSGVRASPPEFRQGQRVRVYYDPANPAGSARVNSLLSMWFLTGLFGILGLVFGGVGLGFAIPWVSGARKKKWLSLNGQRVTAYITGVVLNRSVRNMGKSPYIIMAQWHDPNNVPYAFKSESIWKLPPATNPGDAIEVLIDPQNPRRYWVDVEQPVSAR